MLKACTGSKCGSIWKSYLVISASCLFGLLALPDFINASTSFNDLISFNAPEENEFFDEQSPLIFQLSPIIKVKKISVIIDKIDISNLLLHKNNQFIYIPKFPIHAGNHSLTVYIETENGWDIRRQFDFQTTAESFVESSNELSITYRQLANKSENPELDDQELEASFTTNNKWNTTHWRHSFNSDIWHIDQNQLSLQPDQDAFQVANYLMTSNRQFENAEMEVQIGDIEISQSMFTVNMLNRRGAKFEYSNDNWQIKTFTMNTGQNAGFEGGSGITGSTEDSLLGAISSWDLTSSTNLSIIIMDGGENQNSFGLISTTNTAREGQLIGIKVTNEIIDNSLSIEVEANNSNYDSDTSDNSEAINDNAWALKLKSYGNWYNLSTSYEFTGFNYNIIANPFIISDLKKFNISADIYNSNHFIKLTTDLQEDNIDKDLSRATQTNNSLILDYNYRNKSNFSSAINIYGLIIGSKNEPTSSDIIEQHINNANLNLQYYSAGVTLALNFGRSILNDKIDSFNNSTIDSISITPGWRNSYSSANTGIMHSKTLFDNTSSFQINTVYSLNTSTQLFNQKTNLNFNGIVSRQETETSSVQSVNSELKIDYLLNKAKDYTPQMNLGLLIKYSKSGDGNSASQTDEKAIWLTLNIGIPFSN
jgi:hypothetical protein